MRCICPINSSMIRLARQLPCPEKMILARPARHASIGAISPTSQQGCAKFYCKYMEHHGKKSSKKRGECLAKDWSNARRSDGIRRPQTSRRENNARGERNKLINFDSTSGDVSGMTVRKLRHTWWQMRWDWIRDRFERHPPPTNNVLWPSPVVDFWCPHGTCRWELANSQPVQHKQSSSNIRNRTLGSGRLGLSVRPLGCSSAPGRVHTPINAQGPLLDDDACLNLRGKKWSI